MYQPESSTPGSSASECVGNSKEGDVNKSKITYRFVACLLVLMIIGNTQAHAAGPAFDELRKEAFLRGGSAITTALHAVVSREPNTASSAAVHIPRPALPVNEARVLQGPADKGMSKLLWVGLIAGFAAAGGLVYHFATGPGASVRNCSTC
jgi:hypothetical protein